MKKNEKAPHKSSYLKDSKESSLDTNKILIKKIQEAPSEQCWEEFCKFYSPYIYGIIQRSRLEHVDIEDLQQQILVKAWKGLPKMEYKPEKAPFRAWLNTIIRNEIASYFRSKISKTKKLETTLSKTHSGVVEEADIDKIAEIEWRLHLTQLAFQEVSKKFDGQAIRVFELFSQGKKGEEIAEECGVSINSVYVYRGRIQNALIKEIIRLERELD